MKDWIEKMARARSTRIFFAEQKRTYKHKYAHWSPSLKCSRICGIYAWIPAQKFQTGEYRIARSTSWLSIRRRDDITCFSMLFGESMLLYVTVTPFHFRCQWSAKKISVYQELFLSWNVYLLQDLHWSYWGVVFWCFVSCMLFVLITYVKMTKFASISVRSYYARIFT